jgi:hypothetical protein
VARWPEVAFGAVAAVATAAHLAIGYVVLVSGLVVPWYAVLGLAVWWIVLAAVLVRLVRRRSWWTAAVPVVAAASWVVVVAGGGWALGWSA